MTFLNPFVLFGLAAAAIPILIHLLNKRNLRTIEFSTLTFLKELQKNTMRKITIRQWLLLLLRTLIIIFLVLAFSRPALQGTLGSVETRASSSLVIILDNTASMDLNNDQGKFLSQAQQQALKIVSMMKQNDDAIVLRLSDLPKPTLENPTRDRGKLVSLIQETHVRFTRHTIAEAVETAKDILHRSKNLNKEIYVITDGQITTLASKTLSPKAKEPQLEKSLKIFYTPIAQRSTDNVAIEKVVITPTIFMRGKPFSMTVVVKNFSASPIDNHMVSVTVGKERIAQKNISLGSGESTTLEFLITPQHSGFVSGFVETEDDAFKPDNKRYFSVHIPEQINVLLISSAEKYSKFISTAFSVATNSLGATPIIVTNVSPTLLSASLINSHDVIIVSGLAQLANTYSKILKDNISEGKGFMFFPSNDTINYHYTFLQEFGVSISHLSRSQSGTASTIEKFDLDFPLFKGMFENQRSNKTTLESPDVSISLAVSQSPSLQPIITLSNGNVLLWKSELLAGNMIGVAVPPTTDWSNLPLKGLFVPLLYQSTLYLASQIKQNSAESEYLVGTENNFSSTLLKNKSAVAVNDLKAFDPNSRIIPVVQQEHPKNSGSNRFFFSIGGIENPGIYTVVKNSDTVFVFPVNLPNEESDETLAADDQFIQTFLSKGIAEKSITKLPIGDTIEETILQSRYGIELWKYSLIIALLFALIEMTVAREKKEL